MLHVRIVDKTSSRVGDVQTMKNEHQMGRVASLNIAGDELLQTTSGLLSFIAVLKCETALLHGAMPSTAFSRHDPWRRMYDMQQSCTSFRSGLLGDRPSGVKRSVLGQIAARSGEQRVSIAVKVKGNIFLCLSLKAGCGGTRRRLDIRG